MRNYKRYSLVILLTLVFGLSWFRGGNVVYADWFQRSSDRPVHPNEAQERINRFFTTPTQVPTAPVSQPTATPRVGGIPTATGQPAQPTVTPTSGGGISTEDPCAPGKSFSGPYCGWSPEVGGGGGGAEPPRIGGPQVEGLSYTGSSDLSLSDIILLTGVLCLLLYVRSKLEVTRLV